MLSISRKTSALLLALFAARARAHAAPEPTAPEIDRTPAPKTDAKTDAKAPDAKPGLKPDVSNRALFDGKTISLKTLPNGVRGVVKETRGTGVVAVQIWVRAGSRYETANNAGVSRVIEQIALQNSKKYPRQSDSTGGAETALEGVGALTTSQTTRDATNFSVTVAPAFAPNALRALSDAVLQPRLTQAEIETTKLDLQDDATRRDADPLLAVADLAFSAGFARHPYRFSPNGSAENLEKLSVKAVRDYHAARYVGGNISVVVVGDISAQSAHALIASSFGGARRAKTADVITPDAPLQGRNIVRRRPIARTATALAFRAPGVGQPTDVVAMDVLLSHWSEGRDAALRAVLLGDDSDASEDEEPKPDAPEPLALGFDVSFLTQRDAGLIVFTLVTEPDLRAAATKATLEAIAGVRQNGLKTPDLERARRLLRQQYLRQGETPSGQAGALGFYEMIATYEFAVSYLDRIDAISNADIRRVAQKYFVPTAVVQTTIDAAIPARPNNPLQPRNTIPA